MAFKDFKQKQSVVVVYTGENKGKTSASIGLMCRALGRGQKVAYIQFIKHWEVGEHTFIKKIQPVFGKNLYFFRGGKGFYNAGELSEKSVSDESHKKAAEETFDIAQKSVSSGDYDVVICDEINNAVNDGLLPKTTIKELIDMRADETSLCLTGRNFPSEYLELVDIATDMTKLKHHFDDKFIANKGIDY
ncbi:cob(I)yrinic acid a,c-diamide adenosyltransferase [Candidatus Saccharibacteria bacterium]|nr:cob(I)yrinic acid a,c-diamide adenosyltransferase [Candidatus Saccharibacteria bacterium]